MVRESEWSDRERDALIASKRLEIRGPHGHLLSESTSPDANPANSAGGYYYATAGAPSVDWAEKARLDAIDRARAALAPGESMNGWYFPVTKVTRPSRQ